MRMIKLAVIALASVGMATAAWATPLSGSGVTIDYDLADPGRPSFYNIQVCLGTCQVDNAILGPGSMQLQFEGGIANGNAVRMSAYDLTLNFSVFGQITDTQSTMYGDRNGVFDSGTIRVNWSTPADNMAAVGSTFCTPSGLCELATPPTPPNPPTPINELGDDPQAAFLQFDIGSSPPDALMQWTVDALDLPAFVTITAHIIGTETGRITGPLSDSCTGGPPACEIPEPSAGILIGLGVAGMVIARLRKK